MLFREQNMRASSGKYDLPESRGLTLIELLVYLAVLTLATALAIPAFSGSYNHFMEEALIQNLGQDIRFAQYRAMMEGKAYAFQYVEAKDRGSGNGSYHFLREERSGRRIEWRAVQERWGKPRKIAKGIHLFFGGKDKIYFVPDGEITEETIIIKSGAETIATLFPGRSMLGVEVRRKGDTLRAV